MWKVEGSSFFTETTGIQLRLGLETQKWVWEGLKLQKKSEDFSGFKF